MAPLISVVVPTLNQAQFIEETLASIVGQDWPRLELIVIDGGSTDGTREIVERYPVQHFISEPDKGQADAINKGFRLATGDILAWLNSDDYYLPLALKRIAAAIGDSSKPRLVYGSCLLWYEQEDRADVRRPTPFDRELLTRSCYVVQPSAFWTRSLWEQAGASLQEDYHFVMDWDWWLRASALVEFTPLQECLSVYRFHPQHKTGSGSPRRAQEIVSLVEKHASPEWVAAFQAVHARLGSMVKTWTRFGESGYRWHKLRHLDLFLRHGAKADAAFWQLHG